MDSFIVDYECSFVDVYLSTTEYLNGVMSPKFPALYIFTAIIRLAIYSLSLHIRVDWKTSTKTKLKTLFDSCGV